jgi:hypothetical protein
MRFAILLLAVSSLIHATPVFWTANITLDDGGIITGSFVFDADVGANGTFSDINVFTQGGSSGIGPNAYFNLLQQSAIFIRIVPNVSLPNLVGQPVLTLAWVPLGGGSPLGTSPGLGDSGGLLQAIGAREEICASSDCSSVFGGPARLQNGFEGTLFGSPIPESSSVALMAIGFGILAISSWLRPRLSAKS